MQLKNRGIASGYEAREGGLQLFWDREFHIRELSRRWLYLMYEPTEPQSVIAYNVQPLLKFVTEKQIVMAEGRARVLWV